MLMQEVLMLFILVHQ